MSVITFVHRLNKRAMELYFLHALGTMHAKCKAALAKKAEGKGNQAMAAKHQYMDSISGFYTFFLIQNGSFAPVHRISFRRSGRNRHKSARATFFSLEEGSNFVQKSRQHRTSFHHRRESFLFALPATHHTAPQGLRPQQTIERTHIYYPHSYIILAVPATFYCGRQGKNQLTVVSAGQACNRKRFLPWFQFDPYRETRVNKLNRRYVQIHSNASCTGYCACRKGNVQVVSERLVSNASAFYSLLAQKGKGLDFRRVFLLKEWDHCFHQLFLVSLFIGVTFSTVREQKKGWNKNHDGNTGMCDMQGRHLVRMQKASFPACPVKKLLAA